jgi:outer membrane protein OmpA-like peptidoglycan-associated protein
MITLTSGRALILASSLVTGAFATGCSHSAAPPASADAVSTTTTTGTDVTLHQVRRGDMRLSESLLRQCKVDVDNSATAPKFPFDQAQIADDDRAILDQVATCVTSGPLHGKKLELIGRADPRGSDQYNMELASSRANAVGAYLKSAGVPDRQIGEVSRGAMDATGTNEQGWQQDRRVDLDVTP